jgi:hypothetical protein
MWKRFSHPEEKWQFAILVEGVPSAQISRNIIIYSDLRTVPRWMPPRPWDSGWHHNCQLFNEGELHPCVRVADECAPQNLF